MLTSWHKSLLTVLFHEQSSLNMKFPKDELVLESWNFQNALKQNPYFKFNELCDEQNGICSACSKLNTERILFSEKYHVPCKIHDCMKVRLYCWNLSRHTSSSLLFLKMQIAVHSVVKAYMKMENRSVTNHH